MTHLATSSYTACGRSCNQPVVDMEENGTFGGSYQDMTQHSSDPDFVTCEVCKSSPEFKNAKKEAEENEVSYEEEE